MNERAINMSDKSINFIKRIPKIYNDEISKEFIVEKLLEAEDNKDIMMLTRGDGRKLWKQYIKGEDFFYWGFKSDHGHKGYMDMRLLNNEFTENQLRELLDPREYSIELINALLQQLEFTLNKYSSNLKINKMNIKILKKDTYIQVEEAFYNIQKGINNYEKEEDLFYIKYFLCGLLHLMGNPIYKSRSIFISTSSGKNRYNVAQRYGSFESRRKELKNHRIEKYVECKSNKNSFIILDYWVNQIDNREKFYRRKELSEVLEKYNINWYKDRDNEALVMYLMFPHQVVGYYYFENGKLEYYRVNPFYVATWKNNSDFKIGEYVNIPQNIQNVGEEFPFDRIYIDNGNLDVAIIE